MPDYTALAATAKRLVEAAGKPLELRGRVTAPADPAKPWRGPGAAAEAPEAVRGVVLDLVLTADTSDFVRRGDKRALVAATSTAADLRTFSKLFDGTEQWEVESCTLLNPGGVALLYSFHLRK